MVNHSLFHINYIYCINFSCCCPSHVFWVYWNKAKKDNNEAPTKEPKTAVDAPLLGPGAGAGAGTSWVAANAALMETAATRTAHVTFFMFMMKCVWTLYKEENCVVLLILSLVACLKVEWMSFKRHGLKLFWAKSYFGWLLKGYVCMALQGFRVL